MNKLLLLLSTAFFMLSISCSSDDPIPPVEVQDGFLDATSKTTWHYISTKDNKVIGTGETKTDDAAWAARTDWDFAIQEYKVKTNSGTSSSTEAKGGLFTFDAETKFSDVSSLFTNTSYVADAIVKESALKESKSTAVVAIMKDNTWSKPPVYAFRSADGKRVFAVEFTDYKNDKGESGYVKYNMKELQIKEVSYIEVYINASTTADDKTNNTTWHYVSAKDAKVVGTGLNGAEEAEWAKRTDWDFAIQRFKVKTNSGTSSSADAKGGLYTFGKDVKFDDISALPSGATYIGDITTDVPQMDDSILKESKSTAVVATMKPGMPPVWEKSPLYAFRSANGEKQYKVEFLGYHNDKGASGHITFKIEEF